MEELIDTNEGYRHHGREVVEKNLSSPNNFEKSTLSRTKYRTSGIEMRKATYKVQMMVVIRTHQKKY
jgi:hypothetical protein